jgi:hydroxymethylglutaryl-CoA reductase (NADPH)
MPVIPPTVLKKLYVKGSLRPDDGGFAFDLKNLIAPATITELKGLDVDGEPIDGSSLTIVPPSGNSRPADRISPGRPLEFPVGVVVTLRVAAEPLDPGHHDLALHVEIKEIGSLEIPISDTVS